MGISVQGEACGEVTQHTGHGLDIGDHLYGAKSRILRFVDGWDNCQCLLIGLAAIIPAAKVAVLGKSFG